MLYLRQSTASQEVLLGPFLDDADGKTAETGLTIANTDIKIWVAGATTLANKNSGGATHISNGNYYAVLDATDTATIGSGEIIVQVSGALPVRRPFTILHANVYDTIFGSTALSTYAGGAVASVTGNVGGNVVGSVGSVTGSVGSVTGAVGSVTGNVGGNVAGSVASVTAGVTVTTNNDKTGYSLTQTFPTNFSSLGINASGHVSRVTLVDTTTTNTDMRGTDSAYTGTPPTAATIASQVRTELTTELGRIDAAVSTRLATASYTAAPTATQNADAILARAVSNVEGSADRHSLAAMVMIGTNSSISGTTLTAKKPSDDTTFATYTLTAAAGADPIGGIA